VGRRRDAYNRERSSLNRSTQHLPASQTRAGQRAINQHARMKARQSYRAPKQSKGCALVLLALPLTAALVSVLGIYGHWFS